MLLVLAALQIGSLTCQTISLISSYDEALLKATDTIPGVNELTSQIFKSLMNLTSLDESNSEYVKTLKIASEAPSWLDSGRKPKKNNYFLDSLILSIFLNSNRFG